MQKGIKQFLMLWCIKLNRQGYHQASRMVKNAIHNNTGNLVLNDGGSAADEMYASGFSDFLYQNFNYTNRANSASFNVNTPKHRIILYYWLSSVITQQELSTKFNKGFLKR